MEPHEIGLLLTYVNRMDARVQVNKEAVSLWAESVAGIELVDAKAAVEKHYSITDKPVMPANVKVLARAARDNREIEEARARARRALPAPPPNPAPDWFTAWREAGADPERIEEFQARA
jgi:hypothetical protein